VSDKPAGRPECLAVPRSYGRGPLAYSPLTSTWVSRSGGERTTTALTSPAPRDQGAVGRPRSGDGASRPVRSSTAVARITRCRRCRGAAVAGAGGSPRSPCGLGVRAAPYRRPAAPGSFSAPESLTLSFRLPIIADARLPDMDSVCIHCAFSAYSKRRRVPQSGDRRVEVTPTRHPECALRHIS
jgi:hypothetical protein